MNNILFEVLDASEEDSIGSSMRLAAEKCGQVSMESFLTEVYHRLRTKDKVDNGEKSRRNGGVQNFFYGPVGQYIEHVEHIHFGMSDDGSFQFRDAGSGAAEKRQFPDLPTGKEMCRAAMETYRQGYWWGNRSWAVVFRVYQMKGYMKGFSGFVGDVSVWPTRISYKCNYDAVQKPIAKGLLAGPVDKWEANGAHPQNVKLANALLVELDKIRNNQRRE